MLMARIHTILSAHIHAGTHVLTVGPLGTIQHAIEALSPARLTPMSFEGLASATGALPAADLVVAPLLGPTFDILDIGKRLADLGFRGGLLAIAPPLPDAKAVVREVRAQFRALSFDVVTAAACDL